MSIRRCRITTVTFALLTFAAAGCASTKSDAPFQWSDGWREATVEAIDRGDQLKPAARRDCREDVAPEVAASGTFVRVRYRIRRIWHAVIAPLPANVSLHPGQSVHVNVKTCGLVLASVGSSNATR